MPMVTVSLSPQQAAGIRDAVDDGSYASSSEVVREALHLWSTTRGTRTRRSKAAIDALGVADRDRGFHRAAEKTAPV